MKEPIDFRVIVRGKMKWINWKFCLMTNELSVFIFAKKKVENK